MYGYLPQASRQMSTMRSAQILSNAISDMQRFYSLEVTGLMDPETIRLAQIKTHPQIVHHAPYTAVDLVLYSSILLLQAGPDSSFRGTGSVSFAAKLNITKAVEVFPSCSPLSPLLPAADFL